MLAELHHMNAENQRLRDEVDKVNDKYHALHNQLIKQMEKQRKNEVICFFVIINLLIKISYSVVLLLNCNKMNDKEQKWNTFAHEFWQNLVLSLV